MYASYQNETASTIASSLASGVDNINYHSPSLAIKGKTSNELLKLYNLTLKAYYNLNNPKLAMTYIDSSINVQPYFYNLYLKSKIYDNTGQAELCTEVRNEARTYYAQGFQAILYKDLYDEINDKSTLQNFATLEFDSTTFDIGSVRYKTKQSIVFKLRNTGKTPLIIFGVKVCCGCRLKNYQKSPIKPNEESEIAIECDFKNKGFFIRNIHVLSNSKDAFDTLTITGAVE